jgi:hypothetical protein
MGVIGCSHQYFGPQGQARGARIASSEPKTARAFCLVVHKGFSCLCVPTLAHLFGCLQTNFVAHQMQCKAVWLTILVF